VPLALARLRTIASDSELFELLHTIPDIFVSIADAMVVEQPLWLCRGEAFIAWQFVNVLERNMFRRCLNESSIVIADSIVMSDWAVDRDSATL
jgi:hypothetical protein